MVSAHELERASVSTRPEPGRDPAVVPGMTVHTRSGGAAPESPFEKPVILPSAKEQAAALHAWADARFAIDIMAEHALFFMLLMPPEVAPRERADAEQFHKQFSELLEKIETAGPPAESDVHSFATS